MTISDRITSSPTPSAAADPTGPRRRRTMTITATALVLLLVAAAAYFVTNRDTPVVDTEPAGVSLGTVDGVGDLLVDSEGRTLYLFEPDEGAAVTCTGGCASKWPPLVADADNPPQIGDGVDDSAVGTVQDQEGADVVTYEGWPLYRYTADEAGEVTGSGKDQNGGTWWALTPSGERIQP